MSYYYYEEYYEDYDDYEYDSDYYDDYYPGIYVFNDHDEWCLSFGELHLNDTDGSIDRVGQGRRREMAERQKNRKRKRDEVQQTERAEQEVT